MVEHVLIIGSGGREAALGWKLEQSLGPTGVLYVPGNGGLVPSTWENPEGLDPNNFEQVLQHAKQHNFLVVVGPEAPLENGIADYFAEKGMPILAPTSGAARIETSKVWSKQFMAKNGIPTAPFQAFDDPDEARSWILEGQSRSFVIKADGLAAGKGVFVCSTVQEELDAIERIMVKKEFGRAGNRIIIEDKLEGYELSYIALTDGETVLPFVPSKDHKRRFDGDKGPNTGGMGSYAPFPVDDALRAKLDNIMHKAVDGLRAEGTPFVGFLYAGIMVVNGEPHVLEFNARMGDPECQSLMLLLKSDLFPYLVAASRGELSEMPQFEWKKGAAVCVILAGKDYPQQSSKGEEITGLFRSENETVVFPAGVALDKRLDWKYLTNGGRIVGVAARRDTLDTASSAAYAAAERINFPSKALRSDIGVTPLPKVKA